MNPELIYKYLENTATDDEMKQVLDWLDADPAHVRELDELDKVMAASVIYGPDVLSPAPAKKAARRISLGRIPLRRIVRYAAELAAVAVVGIGVARMLADDRIEEWTRRTTALEVPAGQYLSMELQDGTKVWLNAGTRLEYPLVFAGGERRVKVAGEAMFDVEHDPAHPFVVETFACDVRVLGTKFNVEANEEKGIFSADLLRGKVQVCNRTDRSDRITMEPNQTVHLENGKLQFHAQENADKLLWTDGILCITGMTFEEVMAKFERCYDINVEILRDDLPQIEFQRCKLRISEGIDHALAVLQHAADFRYERDITTNTLYIR